MARSRKAKPRLPAAVDGKSVAKRGRIPGITHNPRLKRVL